MRPSLCPYVQRRMRHPHMGCFFGEKDSSGEEWFAGVDPPLQRTFLGCFLRGYLPLGSPIEGCAFPGPEKLAPEWAVAAG